MPESLVAGALMAAGNHGDADLANHEHCEDNRGVIIYHPDGAEHWVTSCFELPVAIDPDDFDASFYVAEFTAPPIFH